MMNIQMATVKGYAVGEFLNLENVQIVQTIIEGDIDATPALLINPAGDESAPKIDDRIPVLRIGNFRLAIGGLDSVTPITEQGEKRFYSRDADGNIISSFYMKKDGSIEINNDPGKTLTMNFGATSIEFSATGMKIIIGGVTYDALTHIHSTGVGPSGPFIPPPA